jgi:hypothetical protein
VPEPPDAERRLTALEGRVEDLAAARQDATAARHLAAAHDRDLADLGVKVDANRRAINALGVQTAARFDRLEAEMRAGFAETGRGFAEMRGRLDGVSAGYQHIVELLNTLRDDQR